MSAESLRQVKWSSEASKFWDQAENNSVVLQFVVSYGSVSQTEKGFEDLVNTLNDSPIKNKIKKLVITDTSYLYRHCIPEFSAYSDPSFRTIWYLNNKSTIEQLQIETEFNSWVDGLKTPQFKEWFEKLTLDYNGGGDESRIVRSFRDKVLIDSTLSSYKGDYDLKNCIDFMLEECAYACAFLNNSNILYPMSLARCMSDAFERYGISATLLNYKTSRHAQKHTKYRDNHFDMLDKEIAIFMKEKVSNVSFFVIDKEGNHIYKNYHLQEIVSDLNAKELSQESWKNSVKVMQSRQMENFEEKYQDKTYVTVKAPLIIDDEVEGVIGLSVDITDTKKVEEAKNRARELEFLNRLQQLKINFQDEFVKFISQMAHDIASPLVCLEGFRKSCDNLSQEQKELLKNITQSIKSIADDLTEKYRYNKEKQLRTSENRTIMYSAIKNVIQQKKLQYNSDNIVFNFDCSIDDQFITVDGKLSDFERMISNLINNAVEAYEVSNDNGDSNNRFINIGMNSLNKDHKIVVTVEDQGEGLSEEKIEQLKKGVPLISSKRDGIGLGLNQVLKTVNMYNGDLDVLSERGKGTKIIIAFPISEKI